MTTRRPPVSVCMAVYNGEEYLTAQLESIFDEVSAHDEIIVVDDQSTDGSSRLLGELSRFAPCAMRVITHAANSGAVGAFESAIAASTMPLICLSDQDDVWPRGRLAALWDALSSGGTLACGNLRSFPDGSLETRFSSERLRGSSLMRFMLWPGGSLRRLFGCTVMFDRDLLSKVLPFPRAVYAHDHWLATAAWLGGNGVVATDKVVTCYRLHGENLSHRRRPIWQRVGDRLRLLALIAVLVSRKARGRAC